MVEKHLAGCWGTLGVDRERFLALGAYDNGGGAQFNMTALALRSAGSVNAVSQLHGEVTRSMWAGVSEADGKVDVGHQRRAHSDMDRQRARRALLDATWARTGSTATTISTLWNGVLEIPDDELWAVRQALRRYLFAFVRERARHRWTVERVGTPRVVAAGTLLETETLTIGFARRFAGYKRPELIFHDPERLARILNAADRPVQVVFAGKAHPADDIGKHHLQRVYRRALDPMFGGRVAFVDDYDLHVAHFLVQGCDVWLNNPEEAVRGERHERHESRAERRSALEHRRRLVGGRFHRCERLVDRRPWRPGQPRRG